MSLRDRMICFADFVGMTLHVCPTPFAPFLFLLPLPNCFPSVCLPTLVAAVSKFFLPLTTSAISGAANSNQSAYTRFAGGTIHSRKIRIAVLPITCASAPNPRCRPTLFRMESVHVLKQPSCKVFQVRNKCWRLL